MRDITLEEAELLTKLFAMGPDDPELSADRVAIVEIMRDIVDSDMFIMALRKMLSKAREDEDIKKLTANLTEDQNARLNGVLMGVLAPFVAYDSMYNTALTSSKLKDIGLDPREMSLVLSRTTAITKDGLDKATQLFMKLHGLHIE